MMKTQKMNRTKTAILTAAVAAFAAAPALAQGPASPSPSQQRPYAAWPTLSGPSVPHERTNRPPLAAGRYGYMTEPPAPNRRGPYAAWPSLSQPSAPHEYTGAMRVAPAQPVQGAYEPATTPNQSGPYAAWPHLSGPSLPDAYAQDDTYRQYGSGIVVR